METRTTHGALGLEHDAAARERRDCAHPDRPHRHGTRVAYVADGCRCTQCRAANRATERHRMAALRVGCWQPYVDPGPARVRLKLLRENGVGLDQIAKITNTPKSTIRRLLREPEFSPRRIRPETADRLMAVRPSPEYVAPRSQVDAAETRCRIEILVAAGHSIPELARARARARSASDAHSTGAPSPRRPPSRSAISTTAFIRAPSKRTSRGDRNGSRVHHRPA